MLDKEKRQIKALKPGVVHAVEALFTLVRSIEDSELSISDLTEGLALAIAGPRQGDDGHDTAILALLMMVAALEADRDREKC